MAFSSQLASLIARIKVVIQSHTSIASTQVHTSRRTLRDKASWMALGWDAALNVPSAWTIDRAASPVEEYEGASQNENLRQHDITINAWRQVFSGDPQTGTVDTGRASWRKLTEEVCDLIRRDEFKSTPFDLAAIQYLSAPVIDVDDEREIMDTLCHYTEIRLSVTERIVWP